MSITPNRLPWLIDINVFMTPISWVAVNTPVANSNAIRNGFSLTSGAQDAEWNWDVVLARGTWDFELMHVKGSNRGIYSVQFDGVEKGTIDGYDAATQYNTRSTITGIAVAETGKVRLKLKMATKNAGSGAYLGVIQHIQLRRTA